MLRFEIGHREGGQKIGRTFEPDGQTDKHRSLLYRLYTHIMVYKERS